MSDIAIQVENLSKRYRIGAKEEISDTLLGSVASAVKRPLRNLNRIRHLSQFDENGRPPQDVIWAVKDVSFTVEKGEVVGIIGVNGSGKSTLLKLLSRITVPTEGSATINGRVSSLLEVGTGFHPELTGRENTYLNGTILGMRKKEIDRKMDDIIEFAGIDQFMDTPVKRYSSGMSVRLAFAVAAHLEPETLMVDEVLAVGDVGFQQKCLAKMGDVAHSGSTILFVSHNMGSITSLCDRAILLNEGRIEHMGPVRETVNVYLHQFTDDIGLQREWGFQDAPVGKTVRIKSVTVEDHLGKQNPYLPMSEPIQVTIDYWITDATSVISVGFWLFDGSGNAICSNGNLDETKVSPPTKPGLYRSKCEIPRNLLSNGRHTLTVGAFSDHTVSRHPNPDVSIPLCVAFDVIDDHKTQPSFEVWPGAIKPGFKWQTTVLDELQTAVAGDS